jgi:hypothetical protein
MKMTVGSRLGGAGLLGSLLAHGPWMALGLVIATGIAVSAYCVCAERARRKTLIALLRVSPDGTVVTQKSGPGGPEMWVQVGKATAHAAEPVSEPELQQPAPPGAEG